MYQFIRKAVCRNELAQTAPDDRLKINVLNIPVTSQKIQIADVYIWTKSVTAKYSLVGNCTSSVEL